MPSAPERSPRTLVLVAPYFPPRSGGLERYAFEMGVALHQLGWRVVVVTSGEVYSKVDEDSMTVYRLPYQWKISNTPFSFRWFRDVRGILKDERPDVVNVHTPVPGIGDIAAFLSRVPLIVTYHSGSMRKGTWMDVFVASYELFVLPYMLRKAAWIVSASEAVRSGFLKTYAHKSSTLPPGVDSQAFHPAPALESEPRLLFVSAQLSRAYAHKGLSTVLAALQILHARGARASLDIVGDGDMRESYLSDVRKAHLGEYVRFHGELAGEALARAYRTASIFVLPTSNDSYPIAILEALASGLPVISTRVGDIPHMVEDGKSGFLVPTGEASTLAEKIEILITDPGLREAMGRAARTKAASDFSWADRARAMDEVLQKALARQIVHICGYYPPHIGGIERVVSIAAKMLGERGWNVRVITSGGPVADTVKVTPCQSEERSVEGKVTVTRLLSFEFAHTPIAPTLLFHLFSLPKHSIIHLHLAQAFWPEMVRLAAWLRGFPHIVHYHLEVEPSGFFGPLFAVYKKMTWGPLLRGATRVITCSEAQKEWIVSRYRVSASRVQTIPNAVDEAFFAEAHDARHEVVRLLSIGRLTNQKRVDRTIRACALLTVPYHLTIAGDGEDRRVLEALAKKAGVAATFVGAVDDARMRELHRTHDIFLMSSEREGGTPLTVLEACAGGLPIIALDAPGVRELVAAVGIVVAPDEAQFAAEIERVYHDGALYRTLAHKSITHARLHTKERYADSLSLVYKAL